MAPRLSRRAPSPDCSCCRPTTPKFRRNRERVARDAERERLILEWDLGYEEPETA
jgi:hypothetical protein